MKKILNLAVCLGVILGLAGCAAQQGPLREKDAWKRNKAKQKEIKYQFGHR